MYNNPQQQTGDMRDMKANFNAEIDKIITYLYAGAHWHLRAAAFARKNLIRGFGRWHCAEAKGDSCALEKLEKIIGDKLGYIPTVDMNIVSRAEAYTMPDMNAFKMHFDIWEKNEKELIECLNEAIHMARKIDIQIYQELICLEKEVQDEMMRARMAKESLAFAGWNPHDTSVKSKWIHEYFEHEHEPGGEININLG